MPGARRASAKRMVKRAIGKDAVHPALIPGVGVEQTKMRFGTNPLVFAIAGVLILSVIIWAVIAPDNISTVGDASLGWVTTNFGWMFGLLAVTIVICVGVGLAFRGPDPWDTARTTFFTGVIVAVLIFVDRVLQEWSDYSAHPAINNRPIATIGASTPNMDGSFWMANLDTFTHLLLPSLALILISFASYTRYTRGSMLEVMGQDYIRTARAKGLNERTVVMRHALRNALLPLASIVPVDIITMIGGAVITETIFGWNGMGRLFIDSMNRAELDPIMAYIVITGLLAIIANLVADFLYAVLDPRIRVNA